MDDEEDNEKSQSEIEDFMLQVAEHLNKIQARVSKVEIIMEELSKVAYINAIRLIKTSGPKTCKLQEWHQQHVLNLVRVLEPKPEITMIRIHSKAVEVVYKSWQSQRKRSKN